jgi:BTB/POZ domain
MSLVLYSRYNFVSLVMANTRQTFDTDNYSDLTIKCSNRYWEVHYVIMCSQSKVLHAICTADKQSLSSPKSHSAHEGIYGMMFCSIGTGMIKNEG